ncbi:MAG: RsmG family class I SAM-dependent methyltransferase [Thermodesulforhabdaceae bacterium]
MISIPSAPPWFSEKLARNALEAGCVLNDEQIKLLRLHAEWVFFWNRVTNLTAVETWEDLIFKHYLDAIIPACRWLPRVGRVLDIGSGAGFPGIPIKIFSPELDVTLCELRRRKASFLKSFIAYAGLKNIRVEQLKWQEAIKQESEKFDLVTVRALKLEHKEIEGLFREGLKDGGVIACWSTPHLAEKSLSRGILEYEWEKSITTDLLFYSLPGGIERVVVLFKKR